MNSVLIATGCISSKSSNKSDNQISESSDFIETIDTVTVPVNYGVDLVKINWAIDEETDSVRLQKLLERREEMLKVQRVYDSIRLEREYEYFSRQR